MTTTRQKARTRLLTFLIALTLASLSVLTPGTAHGAAVFSDIDGHWGAPYILAANADGQLSGFPDGTFRPDETVTRGQLYSLVARSVPAAQQAQPNVPTGAHWAADAVARLEATDLLSSGTPLTAAYLDAPVSRAEVAQLLARAAGWRNPPQAHNRLLHDIGGRADARWITAAVASGLLAGYPDGRFGPDGQLTRAEAAVIVRRLADPALRPTDWREQYTYTTASGATVSLNVLRFNMSHPDVRAEVLLPAGGIGSGADLGDMAQAAGVKAAINANYLDAYLPGGQEKPADALREPWDLIVTGGKPVHLGAYPRAAIGFWADGSVKIGRVHKGGADLAIGGLEGKWEWPYKWPVYAINHALVGSPHWSIIFTPERGPAPRFNQGGDTVVVEDGKVARIVPGIPASIPSNGFLINMQMATAAGQKDVLGRFKPGMTVDYKLDAPGWDGVQELVQAGPLLVAGGAPDIDLDLENFIEEKIRELAMGRSFAGMSHDGILTIGVTTGVTVHDLAAILIDLGLRDATSLDGGGSSALWYDGRYLAGPGRKLANGLGIYVGK